jgi:hypothetical protein
MSLRSTTPGASVCTGTAAAAAWLSDVGTNDARRGGDGGGDDAGCRKEAAGSSSESEESSREEGGLAPRRGAGAAAEPAGTAGEVPFEVPDEVPFEVPAEVPDRSIVWGKYWRATIAVMMTMATYSRKLVASRRSSCSVEVGGGGAAADEGSKEGMEEGSSSW